MTRRVKLYGPEIRRYTSDNLLCPSCGNTNAFAIDLRLRHTAQMQTEGVVVGLDEQPTEKVLTALSKNMHRILDKGFNDDRPRIKCANCGDAESIDLLERITDMCWNEGCPGCWWCGNYLEEKRLIELCSECIISKDGKVVEDDCGYSCPHSDQGLGQALAYRGLTLKDLKKNLGY